MGLGSPSDMESDRGELKGPPERSGFGSVGFFVPHCDEEAVEFVGATDGRHDGGVSHRSRRGALPLRRALRVSSSGLRLRPQTRKKYFVIDEVIIIIIIDVTAVTLKRRKEKNYERRCRHCHRRRCLPKKS